MTPFIPSLTVTLMLITICHARAANLLSRGLTQNSAFHPVVEDTEEDAEAGYKFRTDFDEVDPLRLNGDAVALRNGWLIRASGQPNEAARRAHPIAVYGSPNKRIIPGLESLLLSCYYHDAAKLKRQPHEGFHASRG